MAQTTYTIPNRQVPNNIYQLAATSDLGELTTVYKPAFTNPLIILGLTLAAIIADIIAIIIIYYIGYIAFYLIIVPILVVLWAIGALSHANLRVYIFTNGFIRARGRKGEAARWDQIATIQEKVTRSRNSGSFTYTVQRQDGKILQQGTPLINSEDMGIRMTQEITKIHLPQAKMAYESGQTLAFGKINVNMQGINNGRELVPWNQIGRVTVNNGILCIEQNGHLLKWSSVKAADVPNLSVLIALVNQIVRRQ